jgi:hypothetical protein
MLQNKGTKTKRLGKGTGMWIPPPNTDHDPLSMGKATKGPRIFSPKKHGKGMMCIYESQNPRNIKRPVVAYLNPAGDFYGQRFKKGIRRKMLQGEGDLRGHPAMAEALRAKVIAKNKSRLRAMAIVEHLQLEDISGSWLDLEEAMVSAATKHKVWRKIDFGYTFFDSVLLEWACSSDVWCNMQAMNAHTDGGGKFESLTLDGTTASTEGGAALAKSLVPGLISLPMHAVQLQLDPGRTVIHAQFQRTVHVADNTRNSVNYTEADNCEERKKKRKRKKKSAAAV